MSYYQNISPFSVRKKKVKKKKQGPSPTSFFGSQETGRAKETGACLKDILRLEEQSASNGTSINIATNTTIIYRKITGCVILQKLPLKGKQRLFSESFHSFQGWIPQGRVQTILFTGFFCWLIFLWWCLLNIEFYNDVTYISVNYIPCVRINAPKIFSKGTKYISYIPC